MERTSLYRTIQPLVELKAVKIQAAKHGKAKIAQLTKKGEKLMLDAEPYWEQAQERMVGLIGRDEWMRMQSALLKIPELLSGS